MTLTVELPTVAALQGGVIEDARARERRHRAVAVVVAVAIAALGGAAYVGWGGGGSGQGSSASRSSAGSGRITTTAAAAVFARDPDMGVACHVPSWIGCDRVGLAVWLRHPAIAVTATIAGAALALNNPNWSGPAHSGRRTMFAGFLQPAGLTTRLHVTPQPGTQTWLGGDQPTPTVLFRIDYGHGKIVRTSEAVGIRAGWG